MFHISVSNRQDWKQFWSHQHSCYWQQTSCLELCLQGADTTARGSSKHQQLPSAIPLQNPGKLQIKTPPLHLCTLNPQPDTVHISELMVQCIICNYGLLYLLFTKTCFVSMPQNPDFLTGGRAAGPQGTREEEERRNTHKTTTAFRNKIYSNFKQRVYFRRKI